VPTFPERPEDIPKDPFIGDILLNKRSEELASYLMDIIEEENTRRKLLISFAAALDDPQKVAGVSPELVKTVKLSVSVSPLLFLMSSLSSL